MVYLFFEVQLADIHIELSLPSSKNSILKAKMKHYIILKF